ncbi:class II histocompatibility antigen, M beta 1 chain [Ornithorhynchus anatinus]|uniref:class II histocompatibility antigen, M beta 1 chain n=1 Tax=Ornithorhynchus anatinus TaxID=9258 RepID=UPI0010A7F873|nr:class II histocompatibility antigen, M beta 1 chain [Ornithorhynchus anatinus]
MLPLPLMLLASLLCPAADGFVVHVESSCTLDDDRALHDFSYCVSFNKMELVCWDDRSGRLEVCHFGVLAPWAQFIAAYLNNNTDLIRRLRDGPRACLRFAEPFWEALTGRTRPPSVLVSQTTPFNTRESVMLVCSAWGFYPGRLAMAWLKNGRPIPHSGARRDPQPAGDWTYQARLYLALTPGPGDVYTCQVQHPARTQPYLVHWTSGLSPQQTLKVSVSLLSLGLGLLLFSAGLFRWRTRAPPGYVPISGSNYPEGRNF